MPDPISTPGDRPVLLRRYGALTYLSLGFNALILLLILIGMVFHHPPPGGPGRADRMGARGWTARDGGGGFGSMRHGWRHGGMDDRDGNCRMPGPAGFAMGNPHGWGGRPDRAGGPGERGLPGFGGPPMGGMEGGDDRSMPQAPPGNEERTDRFMLMLTEKLALTDDESAQIRPVVQSGIAQLSKDLEAQKQAHEKMLDDAKTKIRAVLTPDQQKTFDGMAAKFGPPPAAPAAK